MVNYLRYNGPHFSKRLCDFAVHRMKRDMGGGKAERITPWSKEEVDEMLKRTGIELENDLLYDKVFVANMCKADYLGSSIVTEEQVARYVKDYLDDEDGYDGIAFNRWYADCCRKGVVIDWENMM